MHKSLPKNPKFKKYRKLWGFSQKYKMFQYTTWGREKFWIFQILFLTPFCNQKRYFCVFWPFYAQILTKKTKIQQIMYNVREAHGQNLILLKSPLIKPTVRHPCTWMSWSITDQLGWSWLLSKVSFLSNAPNLLQFHCARKKDFPGKNRLYNPEKAFLKHF